MADQGQVEMAFGIKQYIATPSPAGDELTSKALPTSGGAALRRTELVMRGIAIVSSIAGLVFLATDRQSRAFTLYTSVIIQTAVYSDTKALLCTVFVLGMVAVYSVLQMIRCLCVQSSSSIPPSSALSWTIFMFDQLMTYLLLSVSAASAQSAWFAEQGSEGFKWAKVCYLYEKFCQQVGSGMFGAFVACLALAITSVISAFSLFANGDYVQ